MFLEIKNKNKKKKKRKEKTGHDRTEKTTVHWGMDPTSPPLFLLFNTPSNPQFVHFIFQIIERVLILLGGFWKLNGSTIFSEF